jgi:hypothetical protein
MLPDLRLPVLRDSGDHLSQDEDTAVELVLGDLPHEPRQEGHFGRAIGLGNWRQLAERRTEPNSGLGQAIGYLLRHWKPLTLFLRKAGSPLDNNIAGRALKRAILHRKNALFYRTLNGAQVGDLFMSLIHTCQLCGANSFDYLVELQRHARELAARPAEWMPWNYRETLARPDPV